MGFCDPSLEPAYIFLMFSAMTASYFFSSFIFTTRSTKLICCFCFAISCLSGNLKSLITKDLRTFSIDTFCGLESSRWRSAASFSLWATMSRGRYFRFCFFFLVIWLLPRTADMVYNPESQFSLDYSTRLRSLGESWEASGESETLEALCYFLPEFCSICLC